MAGLLNLDDDCISNRARLLKSDPSARPPVKERGAELLFFFFFSPGTFNLFSYFFGGLGLEMIKYSGCTIGL